MSCCCCWFALSCSFVSEKNNAVFFAPFIRITVDLGTVTSSPGSPGPPFLPKPSYLYPPKPHPSITLSTTILPEHPFLFPLSTTLPSYCTVHSIVSHPLTYNLLIHPSAQLSHPPPPPTHLPYIISPPPLPWLLEKFQRLL